MKIIGFSGKKQSGKSTAVESIADTNRTSHAYVAYALSFADELKRIVLLCFCDGYELLETQKQKDRVLPCQKTVREVLQLVGTDWFRHIDPDCWVRAYKKTIEAAERGLPRPSHKLLILTPDVRFPNEVKCIQELGGHVIRLLRAPFADEDKHESETALDAMTLDTINFNEGKYYDSIGRAHLYNRLFDAIVDNRKMTIEEQNEAVQRIIVERNWL